MQLSLLAGAVVAAVASASTLTPPVLPLIVRNPYLSTWVRSRDAPWEKWPIFWTGDSVSFKHRDTGISGQNIWESRQLVAVAVGVVKMQAEMLTTHSPGRILDPGFDPRHWRCLPAARPTAGLARRIPWPWIQCDLPRVHRCKF